MSDFEDKIKELYQSYSTQQKNTKGTKGRADTIQNFRGKVGFNDTGIALSQTAIKKQRNRRAGYHYPQHLQNINEQRKKQAQQRHGITDPLNPFNIKKEKSSTQPAVRRTNYNNFHHEPFRESTVKRNYEYYEVIPKQAKEEINYIIPVERKSREPVYKSTGKFPKIDEAIAAAKKYRDEQ